MRNLFICSAALLFALSVNPRVAHADDTTATETTTTTDRDTASDTKKADDKKTEETKVDKASDAKGEAPAAKKTEGEKAAGGTVTCKKGAETRTLEKKDAEGGGCEVIYTKSGEGKSIAQAKHDLTYCDKTIDKMKEKLTSSGFICE